MEARPASYTLGVDCARKPGLGSQRLRRLCLVALVAIVGVLAIVSSAHATAYSWYGQNNTTCWQSGFPGPSAQTCATVGPGYLANPGSNGTDSGGLVHMLNGAVGADMRVSVSGEYCGYYNTGSRLTYQNSNDQSSWSGWRPPDPLWYWQEGDALAPANVCQANGAQWGQVVRGAGANDFCRSPMAPCGMQHYASFATQGTNNRPWSSAFGAFPSLNVSTIARVQTASAPLGGAWGYLCPILQQVGTINYVEYCFEQWRVNGGFPSTPPGVDVASACADTADPNNQTIHIDQVVTRFAPDASYSTKRAGTTSTFGFTGPRTGFFQATISKDDLRRAIQALNARCGRGMTSDPSQYALVGVEHGLEGGGVSTLGGTAANLQLYTTTDTLYAPESLQPGQYLTSANGRYRAIMQPDGNFVVYRDGSPVWWRAASPGAYVIMQPDGNLVLYFNGQPIWSSGSFSTAKNRLVMQDDGNLVVYSGDRALWSIWTGVL